MNDKDFVGILITCLYFIAFLLTGFATYRVRASERTLGSAQWKFCFTVSVFVLLLGINKQLDLQTELTRVLRALFRQLGIYQQRRYYQAAFFVLFGLLSFGAAVWFFRRMRRTMQLRSWPTAIAMLGITILLVFVMFRVVSFHHVDSLLRMQLSSFRIGWLIEIAGILVICLASVLEHMRLTRMKRD